MEGLGEYGMLPFFCSGVALLTVSSVGYYY